MEKVILKAETREAVGKEANKSLREQDIVPAVVYKKGEAAISLKVSGRELFHVLHTSAGANAIVTLQIKPDEKDPKAGKDKTVIMKEIQYEPLKGGILHVDFHEISLTEKIMVNVSIETKGEPEGVKIDGGVLDHPTKELQIECLPTQIPEKIEVHVEELKIGDSIRVKDLTVPPEVTVITDPEITVVSVMPPRVEEVEEATEGGLEEPEVIKEKKDDEAPGEGAEAPEPKTESKPESKPESK